MDRTDSMRPVRTGADTRLERTVADALRIIAAACAEREAPPVRAARERLAKVYGTTRLRRHLERQHLPA